MYILGLNAFHGDSSACLLQDGKIIAAVEEERFRRRKHWAGFPAEAIKYCLQAAGIGLEQLDVVAINKKPWANWHRKLWFTVQQRPSLALLKQRLLATKAYGSIPHLLNSQVGGGQQTFRGRFLQVEHHTAHLASSFLVSPFAQAALLSVDGFGDFVSTMGAVGTEEQIRTLWKVYYPHSLGLFYTAITQFLGFKKYGDEYKVMGLAALGKPSYLKEMRQIVVDTPAGFALNLDYFIHHRQTLSMSWCDEEPSFGDVYAPRLASLLGPERLASEPLAERHADIAASLQARYEEVFFRLLNQLARQTGQTNLCLAGGCALNSVANGKVFDYTPFREVYIQAAAYDGGGALGAAFYAYHALMGHKRSFTMRSAYWGPEFDHGEIEKALQAYGPELNGVVVQKIEDETELVRQTAQAIAAGKIVGWFQGRVEWGPRALGNRSILVDPRRPEMKDILNARIKRREAFRPFAPSILLEATGEYFTKDYPDPFMIKVYPVREEKRHLIPAVTHVDGTGRLQTVSQEENPLYYKLIREFARLTGVPLVLNTSFNENEPIVCRPEEALDCFLRTRMDVLVLGPYYLERQGA